MSDIADEIVMIGEAIRRLRATRLKEDTLLLLIQDAIGTGQHTKYKAVPLKTIKAVINGIDRLEETHLNPKEKRS